MYIGPLLLCDEMNALRSEIALNIMGLAGSGSYAPSSINNKAIIPVSYWTFSRLMITIVRRFATGISIPDHFGV